MDNENKAFKKIQVVTNYKTDKDHIEYRVYSREDTFRTCSPRAWKGLKLEDATNLENYIEANKLLIMNKLKGNFGSQVDFSRYIKTLVSTDSKTTLEDIRRYAKNKGVPHL